MSPRGFAGLEMEAIYLSEKLVLTYKCTQRLYPEQNIEIFIAVTTENLT